MVVGAHGVISRHVTSHVTMFETKNERANAITRNLNSVEDLALGIERKNCRVEQKGVAVSLVLVIRLFLDLLSQCLGEIRLGGQLSD